jgi:tetratricopeptide (TPR) repeat protein
MPGLNGIEVAGILRYALPKIRIVLATMYAEDLPKSSASHFGADAVFAKTNGLTELTAQVRSLLGDRQVEAEEENNRGLQEDPLNLLFRSVAGIYRIAAGEVSEGQATLRQLLELDDTFWIAYFWLATSCVAQGRMDEAVTYAEKTRALAPWNPIVIEPALAQSAEDDEPAGDGLAKPAYQRFPRPVEGCRLTRI